ncbi:MAG: DUF898 domain-containing protein [Azoarcus sp.]|jgi:uncharacterized membrane protein YjgN (DUF898 family)|nr:DUF898 domain-containing protein [Azoarcus sp.]
MQADTLPLLPDDAPAGPHSGPATTDDAAPARQDEAPVEYRLRFTGTGDEYFRIWIVNLLLSILTFGIYSAWAKVRREQYFHRNTLLDGSGFDYHGEPKAILKGRIIAVALLGTLALVDKFAHDFYPLALIALPLIPWLMIRSFVFRSRNTSFRGLHFDFHGTYKGLCKAYLVPFLVFIALAGTVAAVAAVIYTTTELTGMEGAFRMLVFRKILSGVSLLGMFLLISMLLHRLKAFQFNNLAFGASCFESWFKLKSFYGIYLRVSVLFPLLVVLAFAPILVTLLLLAGIPVGGVRGIAPGIVPSIAFAVLIIAIALMYILLLIGPQAWFAVLQNNLIWNKTRLDKHRFKSDQTFWRFFWVLAGNLLFMILTLGLYWPWARVKIARYRAEHTAVLAAGSLDDFVAGATREKSAVGEEVAEIFDFDFGF